MKLKFKKLVEDAIIPKYKTKGAVGADIYSNEEITLKSMEYKLVSTGFACSFEDGYEMQIRPRSGLACIQGITVINTPGTIDSDYRGELKVGLLNLSNNSFTVKKGDRIAQFIMNKVEIPEIEIVEELDETERNQGGFGSTGI